MDTSETLYFYAGSSQIGMVNVTKPDDVTIIPNNVYYFTTYVPNLLII
jgi:hypothetical protein